MGDTLTWDLVARDKSVEATLDRLSRSVDGLADHFDKAGKKSADSMEKFSKDTKKSAEDASEGIGDAFSDLADRVEGPIGDMLGSVQDGITSFKGGALAAGALIGGAILTGLMGSIEETEIGGTIAASVGEGTDEAGRYGHIAGEIYADNFGDSIEGVGEAITAVFQNKLVDTDASEADIKHMAETAITAAQVVGESANNIGRAARQLLVNDLAGSADEAFDLIVHASQEGLNVNDDLIDTIIEYSGQFDRLGLKGPEALGLISQAMQGGARDTDFAADAIKEFAIRAQDGTAGTARGFRTIGLDATDMGLKIASGGQVANNALGVTLDRLRAIEDPVLRNQAAVDLFGTKAEDLGDALYDMDLDTAAEAFGKFAGATEAAADTFADTASGWEVAGRKISGVLADIGDNSEILKDIDEQTGGLITKIKQAQTEFDSTGDTSKLEDLKKEYPAAADAIDAYIEKKQEEKDATENTDGAVQNYIMTLDELIKKNAQLAGDALSLFDAQTDLAESWDALTKGITDNGLTLDANTEKGQENRNNLSGWVGDILDTAAAMETQGATMQEVSDFIGQQREAYLHHVEAMGGDRAAAARLLDQLNLLPGNYVASIRADTGQALGALAVVRNAIAGIPRNVNIAITQTLAAVNAHRAGGGPVERGKGYVVGEKGEEFFIPDQDGTIIPNDMIADAASSIRPSLAGSGGWDGYGGVSSVVLEWGGAPTDEVGVAMFDYFRKHIRVRHGGSVTAALGQRGVS